VLQNIAIERKQPEVEDDDDPGTTDNDEDHLTAPYAGPISTGNAYRDHIANTSF